jgi:hypothetical protein
MAQSTPVVTKSLTDLAWTIDRSGFCTVEPDLAVVVRQARQLGVAGIAAEVLADRSAPNPVRARAYGKVALAIANAATHTPRALVA